MDLIFKTKIIFLHINSFIKTYIKDKSLKSSVQFIDNSRKYMESYFGLMIKQIIKKT